MKIKCDNGNVVSRHMYLSHGNIDNLYGPNVSAESSENVYNIRIENLQYQQNINNYLQCRDTNTNSIANNKQRVKKDDSATLSLDDTKGLKIRGEICNKQYLRDGINNKYLLLNSWNEPSLQSNLCDTPFSFVTSSESLKKGSNVSSATSQNDEENLFNNPVSDDMFPNRLHPLPRGIVNPNYPGFQHLAHTLQDYSSNIENFYQSESDNMTDDDIDIEITELSYDQKHRLSGFNDENNINNNENTNGFIDYTQKLHSDLTNTNLFNTVAQSDIPDLIRTVTKNNNVEFEFEVSCSDADIENNFNTSEIIGDFNKEVEDEIKLLLNYNINIHDDLQELRQDIKETFAKPIENTINNISDVVNHVIKKLVETHSDFCLQSESGTENGAGNTQMIEKHIGSKSKMNVSRPTFLLLEKDTTDKIADAVLSDGKDEINTEYLSINVENTIKQLSTELRKIIPKLDQMRENDKFWTESRKTENILTDGNSNEVACSSRYYETDMKRKKSSLDLCEFVDPNERSLESKKKIVRTETRPPRDQQEDVTVNKVCSQSESRTISVRENSCSDDYDLGSFDVYNIETALPKLDFDAIENHLKAAKEAERRKRNDREEIRKRLAMGADTEEYYSMVHTERPGKKPSLHSRLQSGKNLQICYMNETASDNESQASDIERIIDNNSTKSLSRSSIFSKSNYSLNNHPYQTRPLSINITKHEKLGSIQNGSKLRPTTFTSKSKSRSAQSLGHIEVKESDFYALQATLQTEARIALAQAKEMAHLQMERSRAGRAVSPVTEMLQRCMQKASAPLAPDRRRLSRQLLTDFNVAQLQVIVNELHCQIECLSEQLVRLLMARDDLHMGQDSMLVDIEDLTRYLGVKEQTKKIKSGAAKTGVRRLASLVHK